MAASEFVAKIGSAGLYAFCSFFIVVVNKVVLTTYKFPSEVLALGQICTTIVILLIARAARLVEFPGLTRDVLHKIFPLPLFFFGNLVCGLGSTKRLNLPMFTVLRRFSILMTMLLEQYLLGNKRRWEMQLAVYMMITGALVAASDDLSFNMLGYVFVLVNDLTTALNGVYTMKKLQAKSLGKYGILYYNALFMALPVYLLTEFTGGLRSAMATAPWMDPLFIAQLLLSCALGFVLNYAVVLCTQYNSALTTTIVGVLKNIVITYLGMFIGGDYIFTILNFTGLNISAAASIAYSYYEFLSKKPPSAPAAPGDEEPPLAEVKTASPAQVT